MCTFQGPMLAKFRQLRRIDLILHKMALEATTAQDFANWMGELEDRLQVYPLCQGQRSDDGAWLTLGTLEGLILASVHKKLMRRAPKGSERARARQSMADVCSLLLQP